MVKSLESADFSHLEGHKIVVRQNRHIAPELYVTVTSILKPLVETLLYAEAGLPKVIYKSKEK